MPSVVPTQTTALSCFSGDYFESRERFVDACDVIGARRFSTVIEAPSPGVQPLTVEVAALGTDDAEQTVVISSGVHGVESPLGSAVQLALLEHPPVRGLPSRGKSLVLVHVLNPYGYAWHRRFNEDNVDLNRNFLLPGELYRGEPPLARVFRRTLGPASKPTPYATSMLRMAWLAARHGQRSFWETLPVGQYEHSDWLFFGGKQLSQSGRFLEQLLPTLLQASREVVHLDFHTGLGKWADGELLLSEGESPTEVRWWRQHFANYHVAAANHSTRYKVRGGFGPWLQALLPHCRYHYATAEFGTFAASRVIRALAEENRWTRMHPQLHPTHWSRKRLAEAFAPRSPKWRAATHAVGLQLAEQAIETLHE